MVNLFMPVQVLHICIFVGTDITIFKYCNSISSSDSLMKEEPNFTLSLPPSCLDMLCLFRHLLHANFIGGEQTLHTYSLFFLCLYSFRRLLEFLNKCIFFTCTPAESLVLNILPQWVHGTGVTFFSYVPHIFVHVLSNALSF